MMQADIVRDQDWLGNLYRTRREKISCPSKMKVSSAQHFLGTSATHRVFSRAQSMVPPGSTTALV